MSAPFGRSVVIPISFIACAIGATFGPAFNVTFSLFLLVMGLAISTMVYVLWPEPPLAVAIAGSNLDAGRPESPAGR